MSSFKGVLVSSSILLQCVLGSPLVSERGLLDGVVQNVGSLVQDVGGLLQGATDAASVLSVLEAIVPTGTPTNIAQVSATLSAIYSTNTASLYVNIGAQIKAGLGAPVDVPSAVYDFAGEENSKSNTNTAQPQAPVYPKKSSSDPSYSVPEAKLRAAIYIPATFTYGQKPPTIFVPGTGGVGGIHFASNLRKLLTDVPYADPVWLNVPGNMLDDAQVNAEYVAYAINYISGISNNRKVSIISWSQGGLSTQWAFTFWPSTRSAVSDFLPVSPDFHGTILANALCLSTTTVGGQTRLNPCAQSVLQQEYTSTFVSTLRARGGASAYVPTTTIFSGFFDEIVQPQSGTGASAYLGDDRGVGVTNVELQKACAGRPGELFFHEHGTILASSLAFAVVVDALTHDGPADLSRVNLQAACSQYTAPGLSLQDVVTTAGLTPLAALMALASPVKQTAEPPLMPYTSA